MKNLKFKILKSIIYFLLIIFISSCKTLKTNSKENLSEEYLKRDLENYFITIQENNN